MPSGFPSQVLRAPMEQQPLNCSLAVSPLMQGPPPRSLTHGAYSTPASGPLPLLFAQRSLWPWLMSFRPQVRGILLLWSSCPPLRPLTLLYVLLLGCAYMCSHVHCGSSVSTTRQVPHRAGAPWSRSLPGPVSSMDTPQDERTKVCKPFGWGVSPPHLRFQLLHVKSSDAAEPREHLLVLFLCLNGSCMMLPFGPFFHTC